MSTTRVYREFPESYVVERLHTPCVSIDTVEWATGAVTDKQTIDRESRPKPPLPLEDLTARSVQYTTVSRFGKQERITKVNDQCPPDWNLTVGHKLEESLFQPDGEMPEAPYIDWGQAVRNKIKNRAVSFADTIGEWREAVEQLEGCSNVLKRASAAAKQIWRSRKSRRGWNRRLRAAGLKLKGDRRKDFLDIVSADLAINFGIVPTMTLLDETLTQLNLVRSRAFRVQVTISKEVEKETRGAVSGYAVWKLRESKRAILYVRLRKDAPDFVSGNILESLWAGTRLSFMVDWFLNVGSYLSALDAMTSVEDVKGVVVSRRWINGIDRRVQNAGWVVTRDGLYTGRFIWRDVVTSVPMPYLVNLSNSFQWTQLLRSVEVLSSLKGRG